MLSKYTFRLYATQRTWQSRSETQSAGYDGGMHGASTVPGHQVRGLGTWSATETDNANGGAKSSQSLTMTADRPSLGPSRFRPWRREPWRHV